MMSLLVPRQVDRGQQLDSYSYLDMAGEAVQKACFTLCATAEGPLRRRAEPQLQVVYVASDDASASHDLQEEMARSGLDVRDVLLLHAGLVLNSSEAPVLWSSPPFSYVFC